MSQSKRPPPKEAVSPRIMTETVGRGLKERLPPPEKPFGEEIVDEVHHVLKNHVEGICELGPYIEAEDRGGHTDASGRLGGQPRYIAFDGSFWSWFERLTPERREVVIWMAKEFRDGDRQTALLEVVDERIERRVLRNFLRRLWHATIATIVATAVAAHWFGDQISWLTEKIPVFKAFWNLVSGARN